MLPPPQFISPIFPLMSLVTQVRQAGVVGAGGGGFPAHVKLVAKADTVIANGAECEPLLHKQRFALRTVGYHGVGLGDELNVGGKTASASADNAGLAHLSDE